VTFSMSKRRSTPDLRERDYTSDMHYRYGVKKALDVFGLTKTAIYLQTVPEDFKGRRGQKSYLSTLHERDKSDSPSIGELSYSVTIFTATGNGSEGS
jgi:hypothetical protein